MDRFIRLTAPAGKLDFAIKLVAFTLICGGLNHLRHVLTHGFPGNKSYWINLMEASFTALPMCAFALLLIGHQNSLQRRLYLQATRDILTGLPNRRWFMTHVPDELAQGDALLLVDLDNFKEVNDRFGHEAGDRCLQKMSEFMLDSVGRDGALARIGGEEFAAYLTDLQRSDLAAIAERISAGFMFDVEPGVTRRITASVGIAQSESAQSRGQAMRCADVAVYQAKSRGRSCHVFCASQDMHDASPEVAGIAPDLATG